MTSKSRGDAAEPLAATSITTIPYGQLQRAPENVRHTDRDEGVDSLADDIQAHGLLQSLIGYLANDDGLVMIVGGGRRLQALALLAERGAVTADYPVPVLLRPEAEAVELSLAENLARRDMNPADEFVAFAALLAPGTLSPADLAKRFGFTERYVKQRLRLAALAEDVLDALRQQIITLDSAMAYASSSDHALQRKVFGQQLKTNWRPHDPTNVRQAYINLVTTTDSRLYLFVGGKAYEKAGGEYEDDLFSEEGDEERKLKNADVLTDLADKKAARELPKLRKAATAAAASTVDVLLAPGLLDPQAYDGKMPKAPEGLALVQFSYASERNLEQAFGYAAEHDVPITRVAGINHDGKLAMIDRFFVPKDRLLEVMPEKAGYTSDWDSPEKRAERAEAEKQRRITAIAAQLAGSENRRNGVANRLYWPQYQQVEHSRLTGMDGMFYVKMEVYVTAEEIDAKMEEAAEEWAIEQEARRKREEAQAAQREEAKQAAAEGRDAIVAAMPPFIAVIDDAGDVVQSLQKLDNGEYADVDPDGTVEDDAHDLDFWLEHFSDDMRIMAFDTLAALIDATEETEEEPFDAGDEELAGN